MAAAAARLHLQRRRLQGPQHLLGDERVQAPAGQALTFWLTIADQSAIAAIPQEATDLVVVDHQAIATAAAHEQPAQQGRTLPRCSRRFAPASSTILPWDWFVNPSSAVRTR